MAQLFNHVVIDEMVDEVSANALEFMATNESGWRLHNEHFFSQNDIFWVKNVFGHARFGEPTQAMKNLLDLGAPLILKNFNAVIGRHYTIAGHKMTDGQFIGIHNDSPEHDRGVLENYRLIYYLDRNYCDANGGLLCLFSANDPNSLVGAIRPIFNSGVVMQLSDGSYHAVTRVRNYTRYCIIVSYWGYELPSLPNKKFQHTVENCIRKLIELGLEERGHSGTTFMYHLYNTYKLLLGWGATQDTCLAGLTHSIIGRDAAKINPICVYPEQVRLMIGSEAFDILCVLKKTTVLDNKKEYIHDNKKRDSVLLVEIANIIEQACSLKELAVAEDLLMRLSSNLHSGHILNSINERKCKIMGA